MKKIAALVFVLLSASAYASHSTPAVDPMAIAAIDAPDLYRQLKSLADQGAIDAQEGPTLVNGVAGDFISTKTRYCTHVENTGDEYGPSDSYECKKL